jgi:hypothetical protein
MQLGDVHESHLRGGAAADGKAGDTGLQDGEPVRRGKDGRLGSGNDRSAKIGGCPGQRSKVKETWKQVHNSQP